MVVFVYVAINHKATLFPQGIVLLLYIELLLVISIIDLERRVVLDKLLYAATPVSLFLAPWGPPGAALSAKNAYISALQGGVLAFLFFAVIFFIVKNRLGAGDVKLSLLLGLIMGLPLAIIGFQIGIAAGGFVALALVTLRRKELKGELPFAPFLVGGTIVVLLWGQNLLRWYEGLAH
jgi:prepilin signal peptidase PulO-like enzyme (type II secretory pathway)